MTDNAKTHTMLRVQQNYQGLPSQIFTHPAGPLPTPPTPEQVPSSSEPISGLLSALMAMLQQQVESLKDNGIVIDMSDPVILKNMVIQNPTEYQLLQALRDQAKIAKQKQTQQLVKKFKKFLN